MASLSPPKMRQHVRGYYFVHWGGKDRGLGRNKTEAEKRYRKSLAEWLEWRKQREQARDQLRRFARLGQHMRVGDLIEEYLDYKFSQGGADLRRYYQKHLARFMRAWAPALLCTIRARHVLLLQEQMQRKPYAPKTINHDTTAVIGMLKWAMGLEYMPMISLDIVKTLPTGPPPDKSLTVDRVRSIILDELDPRREQPWAAINYLAAMRPSEVVRVVQQQGRWVKPWLFELDRGKMDMKTRQRRSILFSDEALEWLEACRPLWSRLDVYSTVVRNACGVGPSRFRHSAAWHLHQSGVALADVGLLLGHIPRGVILRYTPIDYAALRPKLSQLRLRSAPVSKVGNSSA